MKTCTPPAAPFIYRAENVEAGHYPVGGEYSLGRRPAGRKSNRGAKGGAGDELCRLQAPTQGSLTEFL